MEHEFKVDDRVTHPLFGKGAIIDDYEALNYQNGRYGIKFEALIETIWVRDISNLSLAEPEKSQPKYKVGDNVLAPARIVSAIDCNGQYLVGFENRLPVPPSFPQYDYYLEKHLRPLHDKPIKPEDAKPGTEVWIKGRISDNNAYPCNSAVVIIDEYPLHLITGTRAVVLPIENIKLRHEDE